MHIVVDTQGTDRELEEGGCKRESSIAAMHCNLHSNILTTVNTLYNQCHCISY